MIEELEAISSAMESLLEHFVKGSNLGMFLPTEYSSKFKSLAIEAKTILDEELGPLNDFSMNLVHAINSGAGGILGGPSYASIKEAVDIVNTATRTISRRRERRPVEVETTERYVDPARIVALQEMGQAPWDFSRLLELCRELNVAASNRCHMSTAMLLRTILNHVPPVLGFNTFAEVANNYGDAKSQKSFKANMQRLEGSLRSIADMHMHSPIRTQEDIPSAVQVDFAADLDVLLGEIIRLSRAD